MKFFDGILCKDELTDSSVKFGGFEDYSTENGHSILDYLSNFIKIWSSREDGHGISNIIYSWDGKTQGAMNVR